MFNLDSRLLLVEGRQLKKAEQSYDFISGLQIGIANMADSLAAIKKLVFEEKKITPQQLWDALQDDFMSEENQKIQSMLINEAPKYGNDDDYVDQLVVEAYDSYINEIKNIQVLDIKEDLLEGFAMQVLPQFLLMLDKDMGQWQPQMVVKPILHLLKVVLQLMQWIKMDLQRYSKQFQNYQHMKLPVVFY